MSIKVMSAIFGTEFRDLPLGEDERMAKASSLKIVLLAIADHANDEGESAYPGLTKLVLKTGLSRQGVIDVLKACKYNGLLSVSDNPSKLGTNDYTLNLECYPVLCGEEEKRLLVKPLDQSSHLTSGSQVTLPPLVKPLDHNHPLTVNKPSKQGDLVDGWLHFQKEGQKNNLKNIQDRAESALMRLQYNMVGTKAAERDRFLRFLKAEEEQGRTIEQWVEWCFADGFWPGKLSSVHKVMELWPRAFSQPEVIDKRHEL